MFDTNELSLKFSRGLTFEVVDLVYLSDDYRKFALLGIDRQIEFHAQGGRHHMIRLPKSARQMLYCPQNAELYAVGSSNEVYRISLELGEFLSPYETSFQSIGCCFQNPVLPCLAVGGYGGEVECWDRRIAKAVSKVQVYNNISDNMPHHIYSSNYKGVTKGAFTQDGMRMLCGTSNGVVKVYDIRSCNPIQQFNHHNGEHVIDIQLLYQNSHKNMLKGEIASFSSTLVASADCRSVKVWDYANGKMVASIESTVTQENPNEGSAAVSFNGVVFFPSTGLCFIPSDQKRIGVYYIPSIGIAPRWCGFLDNLTEELEDKTATVQVTKDGSSTAQPQIYDNYQFVTREHLEQLGLSHLVGTPLLRAYMHGFFMDAKLYQDIQAIVKPFDYVNYRKNKIATKLSAKQKMRIEVKKNKACFNADFADKLLQKSKLQEASEIESNGKRVSKKQKMSAVVAEKVLNDSRFSRIFTEKDFEINDSFIEEG